MMSSLKQYVVRSWYSPPNQLAGGWWLLWPVALLYRSIVGLRAWWSRQFPTQPLAVPVVVIGNVTVGGTGKTPLVIALARHLQQQGWRPGILLRGYRVGQQSPTQPIVVTPASDPQQVGDEAVLLARRSGCPVVIGARRRLAADWLLKHFDCNVLLSDDGLQHYALPRNLEIVVIDGQRYFGNGFCLPLGPLREPVTRVSRADFRVCTAGSYPDAFSMQLRVLECRRVCDDALVDLASLSAQVGHAVAGIGNPARFFATLATLGLTVTTQAFPDHYAFQAKDFATENVSDYVIMTEKDAVKCRAFADSRFYYVVVAAELPGEFYQALQARLAACPQAS